MSNHDRDAADPVVPHPSVIVAARRRRAVAAVADSMRAAETSRMAAGQARQARATLEERRRHLAAARARLQTLLDAAEPRLARDPDHRVGGRVARPSSGAPAAARATVVRA